MNWLGGLRGSSPRADEARGEEGDAPGRRLVRSSPGMAALFASLRADGSHVVLDLGPAAESHLRLFRPYARSIRFAALLPTPPRGTALVQALDAVPPPAQRRYDVVLAWNILDLLEERERGFLVERLGHLTAPGAGLYTVTGGPDGGGGVTVRFTLHDLETVSEEVLGASAAGGEPILPARMERVLAPFEVVHGFTLRHGFREYVAVKPGGPR